MPSRSASPASRSDSGTWKRFDPNQAEAVDAEVVTDPAEDGRVLSEVRAGYALNGRVVRPARVRVGRYVAPARA